MANKHPYNERIVMYDGECGLCHRSVRFLIKYDRKEQFRFTALNSSIAQEILKVKSLPPGIDSIMYLEGEELYYKSDAILKIIKKLPYWKSLYFLFYIPRFIRDPIYDLVGRYRLIIFGRASGCPVPEAKYTHRFLN